MFSSVDRSGKEPTGRVGLYCHLPNRSRHETPLLTAPALWQTAEKDGGNMANVIGLRIYKIFVTKKGEQKPLPLNCDLLSEPFNQFLAKFIAVSGEPHSDHERERTWYFEEREAQKDRYSKGHIHYGTFGHASTLRDRKTRAVRYRRKADEVDEIPLYYEYWLPENERFCLNAQQSFSGKSCILYVNDKMKSEFEKENPNFFLRVKKLTAADMKDSPYFAAPVKEITLIRRKMRADLADQLLGDAAPDAVNMKVTVAATRNKTLGPLDRVRAAITKNEERAIISMDGVDYSEATAIVKIGGHPRKVCLFGANSDTGVIDVSDAVIKGPDGHPTYESVRKETRNILSDFCSQLRGFGN